MYVLSAALYVGTPRSSRGLEASDGGRWIPEDWGVLTDARPSWGESGSLPSPLGPRLFPRRSIAHHSSPRDAVSCARTSAPTLPARVPACPLCPPAYLRAHPARPDWRQTPWVKGSAPQGGPCLGGQSQSQVITCVSACKSGLHAHRLPAPTGVLWLC